MILAGDVGGTKTILALYEIRNGTAVEIKKQQFASSQCRHFVELLSLFLSVTEIEAITQVCIGVAGPIEQGDCVATNLPWHIKRDSISAALKLDAKQVKLLNDLEACKVQRRTL